VISDLVIHFQVLRLILIQCPKKFKMFIFIPRFPT